MVNNIFKKLAILLLFTSTAVNAKTVVLIHGLDADRSTWYKHKTVNALYSSGFEDATKNLFINPKELKKPTLTKPKDVFYTIDLTWSETIESQAKVLKEVLAYIHKQRQEPLILVGHSVGGIVARFYLLSSKKVPISSLITIASPHLGSPWAQMAWQTIQSPMADFIEMMGNDEWSEAGQLLWQLSPNVKNNLLYWMNRQVHPNLNYVSIIHTSSLPIMKMGMLVPETSQNMNYVPALYKKSITFTVKARHQLSKQDGIVLAKVLGRLK